MTDAAKASAIPGPKILLMGESGSGKTYSIRTLVDAGLEVFILFTENGQETIGDTDPDQVHWTYLPPAPPSFDDMLKMAKLVNSLSLKALSELQDTARSKHNQFYQMLSALTDFPCERTGKSFGPVDSFGPGRALVVDSLSGLSLAAMSLVVGGKPVRSQADWQIAMNMLESFLNKLCFLQATVVVTSHIEREVDEVAGGTAIMASTLGRKLAPKIPRFFSDTIHAQRSGSKFYWATDTNGMSLKSRNLPISGNLPPDFSTIIESWTSHGGILTPTCEGTSA
jgi:hypothetical protein